MIRSEWDEKAAWPRPLPGTLEQSKELVSRLRKIVMEQAEDQNDLDEACHLIEQLYNLLYSQAHDRPSRPAREKL